MLINSIHCRWMLHVLANIKRTMVLLNHLNDSVDMNGSGFIETVMDQYSSSSVLTISDKVPFSHVNRSHAHKMQVKASGQLNYNYCK